MIGCKNAFAFKDKGQIDVQEARQEAKDRWRPILRVTVKVRFGIYMLFLFQFPNQVLLLGSSHAIANRDDAKPH